MAAPIKNAKSSLLVHECAKACIGVSGPALQGLMHDCNAKGVPELIWRWNVGAWPGLALHCLEYGKA